MPLKQGKLSHLQGSVASKDVQPCSRSGETEHVSQLSCYILIKFIMICKYSHFKKGICGSTLGR